MGFELQDRKIINSMLFADELLIVQDYEVMEYMTRKFKENYENREEIKPKGTKIQSGPKIFLHLNL